MENTVKALAVSACVLFVAATLRVPLGAHCDGRDGPGFVPPLEKTGRGRDNTSMKEERPGSHLLLLSAFGIAMGLMALPALASLADEAIKEKPRVFSWPEGKRAAVSLTFDDARLTQIDNGLAILNKHGIKATFYVNPDDMTRRLEGWKQAVKDGHEIGNHTLTHPCTGNFDFSRENALEDYTLDRMAGEIDGANEVIFKALGVKPRTFGYPCNQSSVGRGADSKSYVPLVAARFATGRGWTGDASNDPLICDPFQLVVTGSDERDFDSLKALVEEAASQGRWLILCGHEIAADGYQTTRSDALNALCAYLSDPANRVWSDTVSRIGDYLLQKRK